MLAPLWRARFRPCRGAAWRLEAAAALLLIPGAAFAQIAASVTLASDEMYRGYTVSDGHPAATLDVSAELGHGLYAGATASAAFGGPSGAVFNSSYQYLGIARRIDRGVSFDVGVVHRNYGRYATNDYADRFWEGYVGVSTPRLGARLYLSPDYGGKARPAGYAEINAAPIIRETWSLTLHLGGLIPPTEAGPEHAKLLVPDWRIGLTKRFGRLSASIALLGQGETIDEPEPVQKFVVSARYAF